MASVLDNVAKQAFPSIFQNGQRLKDAVTVSIGSQVYDAWKAVRINRSMEQLAGSFAVTMADRWRPDGSEWPLRPGEQCLISIGRNAVLNGYIDQINVSMSNDERTLEIIGRDKTADLIDSSVIDPFGSGEFKNVTLKQLAYKFATALYGIPVVEKVDTGKAFTKISIKPGESVFQFLERAAKLRGILLLTDQVGNLVLTNRAGGDVGEEPSVSSDGSVSTDIYGRPTAKNLKEKFDFTGSLNLTKSPTDLIQGQNILSAQATYDYTERYQTYIVKGQAAGTDIFNRAQVSQVEATATDEAVKRRRTKLIVADSSVDKASAQKRANWEAIVRASKAVDVNIKVQGWLRSDDSIWRVNELVNVDCGMIGLKSPMLVTNVTFSQSHNEGTITTLKLTRPDAYASDTDTVPESKDPTQKLGWGEVGIGGLIKTLGDTFKGG